MFNLLLTYRYFILFPLACIEGPLVSVIVGFMIHLGYFQFGPAYGLLVLGDLVPDVAYYYVGRFGSQQNILKRYGKQGGFIDQNFTVIGTLWRNHPGKTMFLSKLAYGLSTPFLVSAGFFKMPLKKFLSLTLPITFGQYAILLTLGYVLGRSYQMAITYFHYAGFLVAGVLAIFVIGCIFAARLARQEIIKLEQEG